MNLDIAYLKSLEKELEKLPPLHRVAFAASCCKRLLPNYSAFAREEGWGDPSVLRIALNEVWQILNGKAADGETIHKLTQECTNAEPNLDYVTKSGYAGEAQYATSAICHTLEACLNPTPQSIVEVAKNVRYTIDDFITCEEETVDPNWGQRPLEEVRAEIASHPFALREISKQREDLQRLKETETLTPDFLEWLRTSFNNDGKSLIDLS